METIWSVATILRQGDFMATLGLKEEFPHFLVFQPHRTFESRGVSQKFLNQSTFYHSSSDLLSTSYIY